MVNLFDKYKQKGQRKHVDNIAVLSDIIQLVEDFITALNEVNGTLTSLKDKITMIDEKFERAAFSVEVVAGLKEKPAPTPEPV